MNKSNFFKYIAGLLLVLNTVLLAFLFLSHPKGKGPEMGPPPHEILNLDKEQSQAFHQIVKQFIDELKPLNKSQKEISLQLLKNQSEVDKNILIDSLKVKHQRINDQKLDLEIAHFAEIKNLLREDQLVNYNPFVNSVLNLKSVRSRPMQKRKIQKKINN